MAQDIVTVLSVETGGSERTIKALKEEIKTLKSTLEGTTIGSKSFVKASKDLAAAQAKLKSVMDSTKKSVQAADGSYDALVATMAELRKEWKATADEAKRDEIGKQIDSINTKLKEMDATIGNHQRNVGNYKGDVIGAFDEMGGKVKTYGERWGEMQKSTEQTRAKFESVQKVASGLASGFAAVQGAAALFGIENENLEKTLVKVQAAMAIAQGIGGMKDLIEGFTQGKTAFQGATMGLEAFKTEAVATQATMAGTTVATNASTTAVKGFRKALISTGIGAILVGIGVAIAAIIENWDKLTKALGINKKEQKEVNKAIEESIEREKERKRDVNTSVGSILGKYKLLQSQWKELSSVQEKNEWINKNKDAFNDLGLSINGVNDAQKAFVEFSDEVIKAIKDQAKARAMAKLYEDAIAQQYTAQQELNDAQTTADEKYKSGYVPTDEEMEQVGITGKEYKHIDWGPLDYWKETGAVNKSGAATLKSNYLSPFQEKVDIINGEVTKIEEAFVKAEQTAAASAAAVQSLGIDYTPTGGGSGGGSSATTDDWAEQLKAFYQERARVRQELEQIEFDASQSQKTDQYDIEIEELERAKKQEIAVLGEYLKTKLKNEKTGEEHSLITQEEYDKAKLEVEAIYSKKIADVEKARLEELNRIAKERLDAINKRFQDAIQTANTQYEISSATATAVGDEVTNARLLQNLLDTQNQALVTKRDELLAYKTELGETSEEITAVNAELEAVTNEIALNAHNRTMAIAAEKAAQLELINEIVGSVSDSMDQLLALDLGSKWADELGMAFSAIQNGISQTSEALKSGQKGWQAYGQMAAAGLNAAAGILNSIAEKQDETDKDGFEKQKKLQIAAATMAMLGGIVSAVTSAFNPANAWMTIWGQAGAAATMSSFVLATGIAQIANIKKQTFNGSGGGDSAGATPNIPMGDMMPIQYTRELMTDTETTNLNKEQKVYVLESDITETQDNVAVKEANASF